MTSWNIIYTLSFLLSYLSPNFRGIAQHPKAADEQCHVEYDVLSNEPGIIQRNHCKEETVFLAIRWHRIDSSNPGI
jgi:hypothetical protein